ncbi:NAD(P)-dependent oxidoreductase [Nocardioides insulae]|uniref:NAD(P)-dependent oxidoreductase n=1 Tax=Nocardioides insulae TaxID=394734 RepID=UPI00068571A1|nr:NAD(P)-dependent oxidoreductase [Nocardioides insulae]
MSLSTNDPAGQQENTPRSVTIVGLGEVGRVYGSALVAAGHRVSGHDPFIDTAPAGVTVHGLLTDAVKGAELVITLTAASASHTVAAEAAAAMPEGAIYADFTSSGPVDKRRLIALFEHRPDVSLTDVAILGPVIQQGVATPLMAVGPGAAVVAEVMKSIGAGIEVIEGSVGDAMAHKLLRSVFMKGLASVVVEAVAAGRAAGMEDWIRGQITDVLAGDGQAVIDRFLNGTVKHARRRSAEMRSTSAYLTELGVPSEMTDASATAMERMTAQSRPDERVGS